MCVRLLPIAYDANFGLLKEAKVFTSVRTQTHFRQGPSRNSAFDLVMLMN